MTPESSGDHPAAAAAGRRPDLRGLLLAGVGSACLLGVGLGLWARPSELERPPALKPLTTPHLPSPPHRIEIRVNRGAGVAASHAAAPGSPAAPVAARPIDPAPTAPGPAGLVQAHAVQAAPSPAPALAAKVAPTVQAAPAVQVAQAAPQPKPTVKAVRSAERDVKVAHAEPPAPKTHHHTQLARAAAERRARRVELADRARPAPKLARASAPHALAASERKRPALVLARVRAHEARTAQAAASARGRRAAEAAAAPAPRPATLHKVSASRCALPDPAAALVCADPSLSAADRRLDRAYREALAAGAPPARLERQQQRWLAARAAAARQAPWVVHDVYLARIAELQDEIRQAQSAD